MYLLSCSWLNTTFAVGKLSKYTNNPKDDHWNAIVRVMRYLRYTYDLGPYYTTYLGLLEGYNDAIWISDIKDFKSMSGCMFILAYAIVSWKSLKQIVIGRSTMKSKLIALNKCIEEAEWLCHFF